jgi:hypothetical protein
VNELIPQSFWAGLVAYTIFFLVLFARNFFRERTYPRKARGLKKVPLKGALNCVPQSFWAGLVAYTIFFLVLFTRNFFRERTYPRKARGLNCVPQSFWAGLVANTGYLPVKTRR